MSNYSDDVDGVALWSSIAATATPINNNKVIQKKQVKKYSTFCTNIFLQDSYYINNHTVLPNNTSKPNNQQSTTNGINLDKNTKKKIDKGKYHIDAVLDLHGYTLDTAYITLVNFIIKSYNTSKKCLLIITGWGSKSQGTNNSIKSNFNKWLHNEQIASLILYCKEAIGIHGGKGAFYLLIKSKKKSK
ncbi:Smr domain-containing protein [Ehrlichia ruminantium]|uniref:Smr domain-containing protein n=1 Tax=Ehrlichia ruminantium TaxID=779 RepID=A0AAE6QA56_EHRRU|nr:Smr/MutS family protein [Ehrlichia ruminantium]QGR02373.1 Smr domain-containing protein [Ehrlichia ruminantium]QGR03292.1 Smr domain-containing protein [Ehrlichia ruminantium]QGR04218.1 Smr domain-containing protein [Ehrlichia ruminantium]